MPAKAHSFLTFSAILGAAGLVFSANVYQVNAACAVSVGKGKGPTQAIAERRAKRDARAKAGTLRPQTTSFSEPVCFVADDFSRGIATYGCEVQYSFCTAPAVTPITKPVHPGWKKHRKHWHKHHGHAKGRITFGAWQKSHTEVACLRFNAKASGRSVEQAGSLVNGALIKSMAANVGSSFQHANVEITGPNCSQTGSHKVTCQQTARYCF